LQMHGELRRVKLKTERKADVLRNFGWKGGIWEKIGERLEEINYIGMGEKKSSHGMWTSPDRVEKRKKPVELCPPGKGTVYTACHFL